MRLLRGMRGLRAPEQGSAVAIGNFDGVHRGHQAVLARLCEQAQTLSAVPTVVSFEPLPHEYFLGADAPPRLLTLRDKAAALGSFGIECVVCLRFDAALAALEPHAFVGRVLVDGLRAKAVVVGDDFRFGHRRRGDFGLLSSLGEEFGFATLSTATAVGGGERISSTRIRESLAAGDLDGAADLLGRRYAVSGRVRRGEALGRRLGFPTANIMPRRRLALADGVYAVTVRRRDGGRHAGAAYWGRGRLEVHLLDFDADLYGECLNVEFDRFVRADEKIEKLDDLKSRIRQDVEAIREMGT